jgi:hypothetical protein
MNEPPPIIDEDRRLLRIYAPELADKPSLDNFNDEQLDHFMVMLRYVGTRQGESADCLDHIRELRQRHGRSSPEVLAANHDLQQDFKDDWEAINDAPWPMMKREPLRPSNANIEH